MPKVQILVGMIASGKSTYSVNAAKAGYVIVNDDSIVNAIHANVYLLYSKHLKPLYKSVENHILSVAIALGKTVVVDRGVNMSAASRKRWIGLANSLDVECEVILFPMEKPEAHAKRRVSNDNRGYSYEDWLAAAKCHYQKYDIPSLEEGLSNVIITDWQKISSGVIY